MGMQAGSAQNKEEGNPCFLEADTGVWRESRNTNGYRISGINVLGEDTQVFQPLIWVLNPSLESPEQPRPAFLTVI